MRVLYCLLFCCWLSGLYGQTSMNKNGLTYKFVMTDYNTLDAIFQQGNDPDRILHPQDINYAGEIGFFRHINSSLNLGLPVRIGSIDAHHTVYDATDISCQPCQQRIEDEFFVGADIVANYKFNNGYLLKEDFIVAPYIFVGVGGVYMSQRDGNFDFQIPMGVGLNIKLTTLLYLQAQMEYRKSIIIQKDNFAISGGIAWLLNFKTKNKK